MAIIFQRLDSIRVSVLSPWAMAHIRVAAHAHHLTAMSGSGGAANVGYKFLMTAEAILLQTLGIHRPDPDRVRERLQSELHGMIPAVIRFGDQLGDQAVRRVAIVADRHAVMARPLPGIELIAHDMAVGALVRVVAEI